MNAKRFISSAPSSLVLILFFLSLPLGSAGAQTESTSKTQYISPPSVALRSSPGGNLLGTLVRNTPVSAGETRGAWTHIQVDAWVRAAELSDGPGKKQVASSEELLVTGFTVVKVDKDKKQDSSKIAIKLQLQNKSGHALTSWSAILVLQDEQGKQVLRTPLEGGAMEPNANGNFNFFWTEEEPEYTALAPYILDSSKLAISLQGAVLK